VVKRLVSEQLTVLWAPSHRESPPPSEANKKGRGKAAAHQGQGRAEEGSRRIKDRAGQRKEFGRIGGAQRESGASATGRRWIRPRRRRRMDAGDGGHRRRPGTNTTQLGRICSKFWIPMNDSN
jgi:hypothetical protein